MSTNRKDNLNDIIKRQEAILSSLKDEAQSIDNDSIIKQNESLSSEVKEIKEKNSVLSKENEQLKGDLSNTRSALFRKLANEKLNAFTRVQKDIDKMYYKGENATKSRLDEYSKGCEKSLDETIAAINSLADCEYDEILNKFLNLKKEFEQKRENLEKYSNEQFDNLRQTNNKIGERLKDEPLSDTEKNASLKQKSLESFIGLNVLSKAGILLFIIGIILVGRYAYLHMSDLFKCLLIYILGGVLVTIGEMFYKKEKNVFSTALISGGVSVLYAATASGYFAFDIFSARLTFVICIIVTAVAILLSMQTKNQIVCTFASLGGYLPVVVLYLISFGKAASDNMFLPVSSAYFCLLAIVVFIMTYNKKWYAAQFISFALHITAVGGIGACAWALKDLGGYSYALPLSAVFSIVSFIIYLAMPSGKIILNKKLETEDTVLLSLNTVTGAISIGVTLYHCFERMVANRVVGIVFLVFAFLYIILFSKINKSENKDSASKFATIISSLSALVFSMLIVPYMFGLKYAPIAWAIEGAILAIFSIKKRVLISEIAGFFCILLSLAFGIYYNSTNGYSSLLAVIVFTIILISALSYDLFGIIAAKDNVPYRIIEAITAISTFAYLEFIYNTIIHSPSVKYFSEFTNVAVAIIFALVIATVLRLGIFKSKITLILSDVIGILLMPITFIRLNILEEYDYIINFYREQVSAQSPKIFNIVLLIAVNIAIGIFFAKCISSAINRHSASAWVFTLMTSICALALITSTVMAQFDIEFSSAIISTIYILVSIILLVVGFKKNYTVIRSSGLAIILCTFAKLCFIDTRSLESTWKILSYFAFGAILIIISFVYQKFSKKLENEAISINDDNKNK